MSKGRAFLDRLRGGAAAGDATLGAALPPGDDRAIAAAVVAEVAATEITLAAPEPAPPARTSGAPPSADGSFLARLGSSGRRVADLDQLDTLFGVLEGGSLAQRRAAAERLRERVLSGSLEPEELERVEAVLAASRDPDVAWEVVRARAALPGAAGRDAREEHDALEALSARLEGEVHTFWEEDRAEEPLARLGAEELAVLALHARELPDALASHVAAVLEGIGVAAPAEMRARLIATFRSAADPRLVPSLVTLASDRSPEVAREAVRALGRIDDPRVVPALARVLDRSPDPAARALAAGALGAAGDARGLPLLRRMIDTGDRPAQRAAVEGILELATMDDVDRLVPLLSRGDTGLALHVVRALGRIGDGRAVAPLRARATEAPPPPLAAEIEVALRSITAQMELRGEGAAPAPSVLATGKRDAIRLPERIGLWTRMRARFDIAVGHLWLLVGAIDRALASFETAALRRPGWAVPHAAIALAQVRRGRAPQALAAFRRALSSDRSYIEAQAYVVRSLARTFLRRAEEMEKTGRRDVALGLLEEVVALDLRRVEEPVRFEISRRAERLRLEVAS
ncbi:MAG: HEAT repeat domain-containing protein [Sandaracinus sp.]